MDALRKKGVDVQPVEIDGRKIAKSFWGEAWCEHLESFSDFENRLPRGRTYVRNGSVCHLAVAKGHIEAKVSGSELYNVKVDDQDPAGQEMEGDQGPVRRADRLAAGVAPGPPFRPGDGRGDRSPGGLFPLPGEMSFRCSCPDWAVDVQARGRRVLRRRGAAGREAGVAVPAPRRESRGTDRGRRGSGRGGRNLAREVQAACRRGPFRRVRHRDRSGRRQRRGNQRVTRRSIRSQSEENPCFHKGVAAQTRRESVSPEECLRADGGELRKEEARRGAPKKRTTAKKKASAAA